MKSALKETLKGILAALSQNKTHEADIKYARDICRDALGEKTDIHKRLDDVCRKHHGATPYEDEIMQD